MPISPTPPSGQKTSSTLLDDAISFALSCGNSCSLCCSGTGHGAEMDVAGGDLDAGAVGFPDHQPAGIVDRLEAAAYGPAIHLDGNFRAEARRLPQPAVTDRLLRAVRSGRVPSRIDDGMPTQPLTDRELEVLRLIAAGFTNKEVAQTMHLAEGTVKNHVSMVLLKLNSRDRTNAVLRALHQGLLG